MTYALPDDAEYARIQELLYLRINSDRRRGGDYAALSDIHERFVATHDTVARRRGEPCDECGQRWPCGVVRGILTGLE